MNKPLSSASPAPAQLEFWFEFASNYSYLSVMRIEEAAKQRGVRIVWKPFLLGPIFRAQGWDNSPFVLQKAKGEYVWKDMARQCAKHGLPWQQPSVFPRPSVLPLRVALLGADQPWMGAYCRAIMTLNFEKDQAIDSHEAVASVLAQLNLPHEALIDEALSEAYKGRLRAQTQAAMDKGVFGAPTFFVGPEMFWGNDRLDDALAWCATSSQA
jgi:2-hydroxychromene-2-carboxylate isomerase